MDIKEAIRGQVTFQYARRGELWYRTSNGILFPVPFEDMGDAQFNVTDKGMFFMRWIRKYLAETKEEHN